MKNDLVRQGTTVVRLYTPLFDKICFFVWYTHRTSHKRLYRNIFFILLISFRKCARIRYSRLKQIDFKKHSSFAAHLLRKAIFVKKGMQKKSRPQKSEIVEQKPI